MSAIAWTDQVGAHPGPGVGAGNAVSPSSRRNRRSQSLYTDVPGYLAELRRCEADKSVVAYFDLDRTLIAGYSVTALAWERMRSGSVSLRRVLTSVGAFLGYGLGRADYHALLATTVRDLAGESEQTLTELGERAFHHRVRGWIYPQARALVDTHRSLGHHIVIVTSATRYQAAPVARELAADILCCTELEVIAGRVTGNANPCFGIGKLNAAKQVAAARQTELGRAYFYSDSSDDLPLLEAVRCPVVVNPRMPMARIAEARQWPCLVFDPASSVAA